ncbi:21 kDa seed protein-like [Durio zibethinus]|uniref:21 kDa seed protein-like n=1 Tax=Durio zibethinus TaxID=66656 RepID=A0A6P5Z8U5_DURZI|nr:21 kDa seed protein-like [Durio zibethinus]
METTDDFIHLSSNLFIKFIPDQKTLRCSESTVWKLDKFDESVHKWFLTTGGVEGDPNAWCSRFQIWSGGPAGTFIYKLAFCPSVCDSCQGCCMEIGKFSSNLLDLQRLVLSDNGWPFMFVKARGRDLKHVVDV